MASNLIKIVIRDEKISESEVRRVSGLGVKTFSSIVRCKRTRAYSTNYRVTSAINTITGKDYEVDDLFQNSLRRLAKNSIVGSVNIKPEGKGGGANSKIMKGESKSAEKEKEIEKHINEFESREILNNKKSTQKGGGANIVGPKETVDKSEDLKSERSGGGANDVKPVRKGGGANKDGTDDLDKEIKND